MNSCDGFEWTEDGSLQKSVPGLSVIQTISNLFRSNRKQIFDVVVVNEGITDQVTQNDFTFPVGTLPILRLQELNRFTSMYLLWSARAPVPTVFMKANALS